MKPTWRSLLVALLAVVHPTPGRAQIALNGNPSPLVVASAVPGAQPESVTDATTTYDVTNSSQTQPARILARLDAPLPAGITLEITLEAPPGAASLGPVALTDVDQPVVVDVPPQGGGTGLRVTYRLTATVSAGVRGAESRQVILTLEQQ